MTTNSNQTADVGPEDDPLDVRQAELTERLASLSKVGETTLAELKASGADARHINNLTSALQRRMDGALETLERANGRTTLEIPNVRRSWQRQAERHVRFYGNIIEKQSQPPKPLDPVCRDCGLVNTDPMEPICRSCYGFEIDNSVMRAAPPALSP